MANDYEIERELGWDDAIERDTPDFILLPEGEYDFTVDHFDRERFNGSDKMPACNKAVIYLNVETPDGVAVVRESLFLHTKGEGKLCAFFTAIGQRQHGQRVNMNWNAVPGAKGRAKIGIREYQGKQYNEVKKTIDLFAEGKIPAPYAFHHLLALKKVETPKAKEPAADTVASVADATAAAADTSAAVADTTANN